MKTFLLGFGVVSSIVLLVVGPILYFFGPLALLALLASTALIVLCISIGSLLEMK